MRMRWGYTVDTGEVSAWAIRRVTAGEWSHVFPVFYEAGEPFYFESIWKTDPQTGKNGVRGPVRLGEVGDWVREDPEHRQFALQPEMGFLPFTDEEVDDAYVRLCVAVHTIRYATLQLVRNWISSRMGLTLQAGDGSHTAWTCSETCVLCVPPRFWMHYVGRLRHCADDVVPAGERLPSIETGTKRLLSLVGAIGLCSPTPGPVLRGDSPRTSAEVPS